MDLRNLPPDLDASARCEARRNMIEREFGVDMSALAVDPARLGRAEEKNCEQMFGHIPIPVGLAGPLRITLSDRTETNVHLPLATTEGALVASVNRGCKTLSKAQGVRTSSRLSGMTRSLAFKSQKSHEKTSDMRGEIERKYDEWKQVGEATSTHLRIISFEIDEVDDHLFLTIACDTDEAMGMNMVTIAAQAIGDWLAAHVDGLALVTVAGNIDSDKKPSRRTHERGRGWSITAEAMLPFSAIEEVLKTTPEKIAETAHAKLELGSKHAGALGTNLHAANVIAALYLATGQDAAHVVEGSLADTSVTPGPGGLHIATHLPAILVGIRGGGTVLPAQHQCLSLILQAKSSLHPCAQLAETVGAAVLAGEISLLAAQTTQMLAKSHKKMAR